MCNSYYLRYVYKHNWRLNMKKHLKILLIIILTSNTCYSHPIIGADLSIKKLYQQVYEFELVLYTTCLFLETPCNINFGDNTISEIPFIETTILPNSIRKYKYITTHTYPGPGIYEISVSFLYWIEGISNISNSEDELFNIAQMLKINPTTDYYNSPGFLNPPYDTAIVNQSFTYNPSAYDVDGDSLSFSMVPCITTNYNYPPSTNYIRVDSLTGDFIWEKPQEIGKYAIAIKIDEWKGVVKIGSIIRQITIEVIEQSSIETLIKNYKRVIIYPNPSDGLINIETGQIESERLSVEILNVNGQVMYNMFLKNNAEQIDISAYLKGVYFLKINYPDHIKFEKVVLL